MMLGDIVCADDKAQSKPLNRLSYTLRILYNPVRFRGKVSTRCWALYHIEYAKSCTQ